MRWWDILHHKVIILLLAKYSASRNVASQQRTFRHKTDELFCATFLRRKEQHTSTLFIYLYPLRKFISNFKFRNQNLKMTKINTLKNEIYHPEKAENFAKFLLYIIFILYCFLQAVHRLVPFGRHRWELLRSCLFLQRQLRHNYRKPF